MDEMKLEPCPFCGADPGVTHPRVPQLYGCSNNQCPASHMKCEADRWNRRQPQSAERALLREVTETWPHQFDTTRCKRFRGGGLCDCGADQLNARRDELVARINLLIGPPTDAQGKRDAT